MWRITAFDREGREILSLEAQGGEITVGREADRRIMLPSPSVSRRHARIVLDGPQPYIADEGSANGVLVNGVKIGQPTAIIPGVRVDIAEYHLLFDEPAATVPVATIAPPPPARQAPMPVVPALRLAADDGPFAGRAFEVAPGDSGVGRAAGNDLIFDDPSLSRRHCRIHNGGDGTLRLEDLGSSNGTYVNGRRLDRGTARIGDVLRFGDLNFRLEGDHPPAADDDWQPAPPRRNPLLLAGIGAGALAAVGLILFFATRHKTPAAPVVDATAHLSEKAAEHLKAGKGKLASKDFDGAAAEFRQAIELDPTIAGEARPLHSLAMNEPANEKVSKQIGIKLGLGGRADLESALKLLPDLPPESSFRVPTTTRMSAKLIQFGKAQCTAKKWADCAWAVCRAWEVAPPDAKPGPDEAATLDEAEKKLARDKSYVRCKRR